MPAELTQSRLSTARVPQFDKLALVVDDEISNRIILKSLLKKFGYRVLQAENGAQALDLFNTEHPDIIFMDIMMPVMDGHETTARIREIETNRFVPIIFLTALTDELALAQCIEVGGDDFMIKPYSHTVLKAKIQAIERIRELHDKLGNLYSQMKKDEEIAEGIFSGAVVAGNVAEDQIHTLLRPAELFSGDVLLSAYAPTGGINIMLGDFTGHGLAAALGALPTSEVFRAMTSKGFSPPQILSAINRKLHNLLPTGMFFAVQFVSISPSLDRIEACNCGMPDTLLLEGSTKRIKRHFKSKALPLGITMENDFQDAMERCTIQLNDRILLVSDGVLEARSANNEYFGERRLQQAILAHHSHDNVIDGINQALESFCRDLPQDDDISLAEIPCRPELLPDWKSEIPANTRPSARQQSSDRPIGDPLEFTLTLSGSRLRETDPVPLVINQLQETQELQHHRRVLFTILTELYVNALDHGILQLDSQLKQSAEGFTRYFTEREKRLQELDQGFIRISINSWLTNNGGKISIQLTDSGDGFDFSVYQNGCLPPDTLLSGRGIVLVSELCESVNYEAPGNRVEAVYSWLYEDVE